MTPEAAQALPEALRALGPDLPSVLLSFQGRLLATTAIYQVVICEKSRRIGMTWAVAADAVLTAGSARSAGGMDVLYIGYNLDMAREFIDTAAMWAKAFLPAAGEVQEFLFKDTDEKGAEKDIQAFRISFASGFEIVALTSKPRSLRGRQGYLIFDEAAFHDDLAGMMKAGLAFLMWGGRILVISTHDGEANPFNGLVLDSRSGRKPYKVLRVTFDDAIADGLYERVALMLQARGQTVKPKEDWIADIRAFYGDDAAEELDVVPAQGSGVALGRALIEARMEPDIPVLRWTVSDSFARQADHIRVAECQDWLEREVKPHLARLDPAADSFFGEDFGRVSDLTVIWPVQLMANLLRRPPFVVELANVPYKQQEQVLLWLVRRLPRFRAGALDATGNGGFLAEAAAQEFGFEHIAQVKLSQEWYRENMPPFVAAFEDAGLVLPKDRDLLNDHAALKKINGVVQMPAVRAQDSKDKTRKRHGDSAIAHALAWFATRMPAHEYAYTSAAGSDDGRGGFDDGARWRPGAW
jgi:phage FluMu gp28-like protein